jgi:predicted RecB family nuclease
MTTMSPGARIGRRTCSTSGLKTLDWRSEWEATRDASLKQKLLTYNAQDCEAVQRVAETIAGICSNDPSKQSETVSVSTSIA